MTRVRDGILGAKPADLRGQALKFELMINLDTTKLLGLTIGVRRMPALGRRRKLRLVNGDVRFSP
jgi:hypothetical protein